MSEQESHQETVSSSQEPIAAASEVIGRATRPSFLANLALSIKHFKKAVALEGTKVRNSDYFSIGLLPFSCLLLLVTSIGPINLPLKSFLLLFTLASFSYYLGVRLGVAQNLTSRQANLIWQVLFATFLLGYTFALFVIDLGNLLVKLTS